MDGFSDIDSGSEVGTEIGEVESTDSDFGDGDGVNDFDETYENMNIGDETMDYSEDIPEGQDVSESDTANTDTAVDWKETKKTQILVKVISRHHLILQ